MQILFDVHTKIMYCGQKHSIDDLVLYVQDVQLTLCADIYGYQHVRLKTVTVKSWETMY